MTVADADFTRAPAAEDLFNDDEQDEIDADPDADADNTGAEAAVQDLARLSLTSSSANSSGKP